MARFPDVQRHLVALAAADACVQEAGVETPPDLAERLPFVRVMRIGGPSDRLNDYATVTVDVFGPDYVTTEALAEKLRQAWCGAPPDPKLDRIECVSGPQELPWGDSRQVRRFGATYTVVARRVNEI